MSFPGDNAQQDANLEESSAPQESTNDSQPQQAQAEAAPEPESQSAKPVPFHEDPRVQEYLERQIRKQTETYEQRIAEMQRQQQEAFARIPQPEKPKNPFIAKLGEIDPVYGKTMEDIYTKAEMVDQLKNELAQIKEQNFVNQAVSQINALHEQNKVAPELRQIYDEHLDFAYRSGRIKNVNDIQGVYKQVHERYAKVLDSVKRQTTASYVVDKSKDASAPASQPKGKTPPRNEKGQFTGDWETDKAQIVARAMKRAKAASDL